MAEPNLGLVGPEVCQFHFVRFRLARLRLLELHPWRHPPVGLWRLHERLLLLKLGCQLHERRLLGLLELTHQQHEIVVARRAHIHNDVTVFCHNSSGDVTTLTGHFWQNKKQEPTREAAIFKLNKN